MRISRTCSSSGVPSAAGPSPSPRLVVADPRGAVEPPLAGQGVLDGEQGVVHGHHVALEAEGGTLPGGAAQADLDRAPVRHLDVPPPVRRTVASAERWSKPKEQDAAKAVVSTASHPVVDVHLQGGRAAPWWSSAVDPLRAAELGPVPLRQVRVTESRTTSGGALGGVVEAAGGPGGAGRAARVR